MSETKVCVITVNYFGAEDTVACIESLRASEEPVQVVVVDNSPNDPELIDALKAYPEVKLIQAPENLGFGKGNNLGIDWALEHTSCEYIFILNNDAEVLPDTIGLLVKALNDCPKRGVATGRIVLKEDPDALWYGGGEINWKRGGAVIPGIMGSASSMEALRSRNVGFASGCTMLFKRDLINSLGGFDPVFFMYEEDVDLSLRVRRSHTMFYESSALILHEGQGSQREKGVKFQGKWSFDNPNYDFHVYHMTRNTIINARKHAKGKSLLLWLLVYPMFIIKKTIPVFLKVGFSAFTPVLKGALSGIKVKLEKGRYS